MTDAWALGATLQHTGQNEAPRRNAPSLAAASREKHRPVRRTVTWSGRVVTAIGSLECTVLNLWREGAYIRLDAALDQYSGVELRISGVAHLPGWVAWSNYDRAGIMFAELSANAAAALEKALRGRRYVPTAAITSLAP
jgi:hypothetical protein